MPAKIVFDKEMVANAAMEIIEESGTEALNARSLAKKLGCSTQPIYLRYPDMEAVKIAADEKISAVYAGYLDKGLKSRESLFEGYLSAYVNFAREKPKLFAFKFMRNVGEKQLSADKTSEIIIAKIRSISGYTQEQAEKFFFSAWFFAHGIACQIATEYIKWSEADVDEFLAESFTAFKNYFGRKDK